MNVSAPVPAASGFRPEIQAFRALAVSFVIVYHVWPNALPGGYIGVDVFFVLSGFLITSHLVSEVERTGRLRLAAFWARRIRRLLPAASVVLVVCLVLMLALVPRSLWQQTVLEIGASALYVQNWALSIASIDYLAADGTPTLVQHFWSLSVEEQFYLVWPLLLAGAVLVSRRFPRRGMLVALTAVFVTSFVWSVATAGDPAGYFDTAARAWEFAAGGLLAFAPSLAERWRPWASGVGLVLLAAGVVLIPSDAPFPGVLAAVPVVGTVLLLAGRGAGLSRVTGLAPVQWLGDVSYSAYLWHWPLVVIVPYLAGTTEPGWWVVLVVPGTLLLAWASKTFVEDPVRRGRRLSRTRQSYALAAASVALIVLAASSTWGAVHVSTAASAENTLERSQTDPCFGASAMVDPRCDDPFDVPADLDTAFAAQDRGVLTDDCNAFGRTPVECEFGDTSDPVSTIAVVGNSHAAHLVPGLAVWAEANDTRVVLMRKTNCLGVTTEIFEPDPDKSCRDWTENVLDRVTQPDVDAVVFGSHVNALDYLAPRELTDAEQSQVSDSIAATYADLLAAGKGVLVTGDVPGTRPNPAPECVYLSSDRSDPCATDPAGDLEDGNVMSTAAKSVPGVGYLSLLPFVCDADACHVVIGGTVVYSDDHHLTASFSRSLAPYLGEAVEQQLR